MTPGLLGLLLLVAFAAFWTALLLVLSRVSGWGQLARSYRAEGALLGTSWGFQSCVLRYSMGYNNCLRVAVNEEGMHIAVPFPLRPGHPPLFLPWEDLSARPCRWLFERMVEFRACREPAIPVRIPERLIQKIQAAMGDRAAPLDLKSQSNEEEPA
jgi:hypothetical protein